MELGKFLFFLLVIGPGFSKNLGSWEESDESVPELSWLFDIRLKRDNVVEKKEPVVCQTNECKIIADEFLRGMNKSVDPCDNFYDYMCGKWVNETSIPPYVPNWSRVHIFQETVFRRIKEILEQSPEPSDILPVRQAKKWFRSCMDTETLNKRGLRPLESILIQIGGWPMTMDPEEWDEKEESWQAIEGHYFHVTGSYIFYRIEELWWRDNSLTLRKGQLPLSEQLPYKYKNYTGNNYETYKQIIEGAAQMFIDHNKADVSKETLRKDIDDLVEFERQLDMLGSNDSRYDQMTIDDFVKWYNTNMTEVEDADEIEKLDFRRLIRRTFDMVNYDIKDSTEMTVESLSYWLALTKLLSETPKRTIVNYIHWHFVSAMLPYTTEEIRDLVFTLEKNVFDLKQRRPRWLECSTQIKMTSATAYAFVQKYFSEETEQYVRAMIDNIREEMKSQILKTHWMDADTTALAIEKLNAMKIFVGFPDWYRNKTKVLNAYKGLTIGNEYFDNILSYDKYSIKQTLRRIISKAEDESTEPSEGIVATVVNAFYSPYMNSIELPAADFQPPLFTPKLPQSINYGITGSIIGHEIGHGFDDSGIQFGPDGNKTQISQQIMEMFYKRAECFLDQYNQYYGVTEADYDGTTPEYGSGTLGLKTRGENIADSTGLHAVYEAYRKMIKKIPERDYKLPGFEDFTDDQMFFVSFGATFCEVETPKYEELSKKYDSHSPFNLRVIGPVSNTEDFAKAFNCPKGSSMNPENKCDIWDSHKPHTDVEEKTETPLHKLKKYHEKWTINE